MATNGHTNGADAGKQSFNVKVSVCRGTLFALPQVLSNRLLMIWNFLFIDASRNVCATGWSCKSVIVIEISRVLT